MAKIKSVQAADPGVGFVLDLTDELSNGRTLPNLQVILTVSDNVNTYISTAHINNTISNTDSVANPSQVFIIPFGDTRYAGGQSLSINFKVAYYTDLQDPRTIVTILDDTKTVTADSRAFKIQLNRSYLQHVDYNNSPIDQLLPGILLPGDQLTSPNGQYSCVLNTDGSLALKNSSGQTLSSIPGSGVTSFAIMQSDGNFCLYRGTPDNNQGSYYSIPSWTPYAGYDLVLTNSGVLGPSNDDTGNTTPAYVVLSA
jgi:hypothetical protein